MYNDLYTHAKLAPCLIVLRVQRSSDVQLQWRAWGQGYLIPDLAIKYHKGMIKVMVLHRGCGVELG